MPLKIYKASDDFSDKKPRKYSSFKQKNKINSHENFAKNQHSTDLVNDEEKFISYEDFYAKNGRDATFGGSSFTQKKKSNLTPAEYYEKQKKRREKIERKKNEEKKFREDLANGNLEDVQFVITKISPAAKTPGRYNIFVNDEFSFSLDEMQLINSGIKKGEILDSNKYLELKGDSDFGKNYVRALDLISRRMRSEKEIREYGMRKQWSKNTTEKVIDRLAERGYINDEIFAKNFVNSRANTRNFSRRKMEVELIKKGINKDIREKILSENESFNESESLKKLVEKKFKRYENDQKLMAYLARQGFDFSEIKNAINEFRENVLKEDE